MKLYNTLSRKLEALQPITKDEVKVYSCGPTVYNYAHIGNLRAFVFSDCLRRVLEASGYSVKHVMNITDVGHLVSDADDGEDKLEKGAAREGKTVWEVAEHYTEAFIHDMKRLNILPPSGYKGRPDGYARATDFIDTQVAMVKALVDNGYAYITKQAIYFDVTKLSSYGALSGQKLADKEVASRDEVVSDPHKKHPFDFAVWFFLVDHFKNHSMHWPSPWGDGFPGWHLECSAIIHATLGDPIDIHSGGVDHIGTHHTNEMAQTEAAFGHPLSNIWLHNEFILVDGKKMSKSSGNFYVLKDIIDRGFDPSTFRLLCLQAHYRSQLNFTWEGLEAAKNRLKNLQALADLRWQTTPGYAGDTFTNLLEELPGRILHAAQDDLNIPQALAELSALDIFLTEGLKEGDRLLFEEFLQKSVGELLGIDLLASSDITDQQKKLITEREEAREHKQWQRSDELRDSLLEQGITLRDTNAGTVWSRL